MDYLQRPIPLFHGSGVALLGKRRNRGVDVVLTPIEARSNLQRPWKPTVLNVTVDSRPASAAEFILDAAEGKVTQFSSPISWRAPPMGVYMRAVGQSEAYVTEFAKRIPFDFELLL